MGFYRGRIFLVEHMFFDFFIATKGESSGSTVIWSRHSGLLFHGHQPVMKAQASSGRFLYARSRKK
jgi:hypothetical protein